MWNSFEDSLPDVGRGFIVPCRGIPAYYWRIDEQNALDLETQETMMIGNVARVFERWSYMSKNLEDWIKK